MSIEQIKRVHTLAYKSKAIATLDLADLDGILVGSRSRNLKAQVTGVLIFMDGVFTQYLEGPEQGVNEIFDRIKASSLHQEVEELSRGWIATRQYPDWSMTYFSSQLISGLPFTFGHLPSQSELAGAQSAG